MREAITGSASPLETPDASPLSDPLQQSFRRFRNAYAAVIAGVALACASAAHGEEKPDAEGAHPPATSNGALIIAGGGDLPQSIYKRFVDLAGGKNADIVIINSASEDADHPEKGEDVREFWRGDTHTGSFTIVHASTREEANAPEVVRPLRTATGVWFSGGAQRRLEERYKDSEAERQVIGIVRRGGVVGGTSAGAAFMSSVMIRRGNPVPEIGTGMDFFRNTIIDQHYLKRNRFKRLVEALSQHPHCVGIGVDEHTALVVKGRIARVLGESAVHIVSPPVDGKQGAVVELQPEQEIDLRSHGIAVPVFESATSVARQ